MMDNSAVIENSTIKAVLFDLDGTLLDTAPDLAIVLNQMCEHHGRKKVDYQVIRSTVSQGARALVTLGFELNEDDSGFEELRQELLERYGQHLAVETAPFPGIDNLLNWLDEQRLPWGVVTNKPRRYSEPLLEALQLSERCHTLVCPDDVTRTKPDPEPLHLACQQLNVDTQSTIYLGDHRRDIEAGINAGMQTLAVNYGYIVEGDRICQWQADFIVDHADEIRPLLEMINKRHDILAKKQAKQTGNS